MRGIKEIMDYVIARIKPDDDHFNLITSMYELTKVWGLKRSGNAYSQLAGSLNAMRKKRRFYIQ